MKLAVIIPALNEENTILKVVKSIPSAIAGIDKIEIIVLNDGSTDRTELKAKQAGAVVINNARNLGLAKTFKKGVEAALKRGADIIVNTDGDNQYDQAQIPDLLTPILSGKADMVIGDRKIKKLDFMPWKNRYGNILGSFFVRWISGTKVRDASSGFRAFTRKLALHFSLVSTYTYTHETIIQTAKKNFRIAEVPVNFKKREGEKSRLIKSIYSHVLRSTVTIFRSILMYKAYKTLVFIGLFFLFMVLIIASRFLFFYFSGEGAGHVQSLVFASIFASIGISTLIMGIIADLIRINREFQEEILLREKRKELAKISNDNSN